MSGAYGLISMIQKIRFAMDEVLAWFSSWHHVQSTPMRSNRSRHPGAQLLLDRNQTNRLPSYHHIAGAVYGDPAFSRVADTALVLLSRHGCIAVHPSRRLHAIAIL
jgi:hypothetical protein